MFTPDEAIAISGRDVVGIGLRAGIAPADWDAIAIALSEAFHTASVYEAWRTDASASAVNAAYKKLAAAIEALLLAAGHDGTTELHEIPKSFLSRGAHPLPILDELRSDLFSILDREEARKADLTLTRLPADLAIIGSVARAAAVRQTKAKDRRETGLDSLFRDLGGIFFTLFGQPPGSDRGRENNEAIIWARRAIGHAYAVAPDRTLLDSPESHRCVVYAGTGLSELLEKANKLAGPTLGERIYKGFVDWRAQPPELRWPVNVWCPYGAPTPPSLAFVPEWLRDAAVPTS